MEGLSIICAGLGVLDEDDDGNPMGYTPGEYCLDNLKDLLRFLRRDDPQQRDVFKQVCKWKTAGNHLLPIIEYCQDDRNLVLYAVKVLVFLTMPIEPTSNDIPQQIEFLWDIKYSVTFSHTVPVILSLLEDPLENLASDSFTEDDWKLVQLVLTLFRNILSIQQISSHQNAGVSVTQYLFLRDRFLELLFQENVMDVILVLSQSVDDPHSYLRQDNLLLLEIFHYVFMGQDPELIAKESSKNSEEDENVQSLRCIMEEEKKKKMQTRVSLDCYSKLSGTFSRPIQDGSTKLLKGNPYPVNHGSFLKAHKNSRGPSKRILWDHGRLPPTKNKIKGLLHGFIDQFLLGGYNVLMQSVRQDIQKESQGIQDSDIIVYFQVAWFVTSFQYHRFMNVEPGSEMDNEKSTDQHTESTLFKGSICGPIAESLNESTFAVVISKWRYAFDVIKETHDYKLLSAAGSLLKIMMRILYLVLKKSPGGSTEFTTARILLYKLFYDQTEAGMTQFVLNMVKSFDTHKQVRSDLGDLAETIYVIFRLMEILQAHGTLRVSKRSRKKKTKKDVADKSGEKTVNDQNELTGSSNEQPKEINILGEKISVGDASVTEENGEPVHVNELTESVEKQAENLESPARDMEKSKSDDEHHGTEKSSEDEQPVSTYEDDFNIKSLVSALRNQTIIKKLCWLLGFCRSNSPITNHCILQLLRRVSEYIEHSPLLFRLTILTTFHDILEEQKSSPCNGNKNIVLFLTSLVRKMVKNMKSNPLPVVDILSSRSKKDRALINSEWILKELGDWKKDLGENTSVATDGQTDLPEEQGWARRSIADALGDDEADFFVPHETVGQMNADLHSSQFVNDLENNEHRSGDGEDNDTYPRDSTVGSKEKDSKGMQHAGQVSQSSKERRKSVFRTDELEQKIKDLYLKYNEDPNCPNIISDALEKEGEKISPAQVLRKLRKLGLKVARKRRTSASGTADPLRDNETTLNMDHPEDNPSSTKAQHIRKRVRGFSEDQDQRIKTLFEQFKDQKHCSLMIANALDTEGGVSAAQVSRRLRKLGLFVSQKKRSDSNFHLRDEDAIDKSMEDVELSDDEPLIALKKRSKSQRNATKEVEGQNRKTGGKEAPQEHSADEFPSSSLLDDEAENDAQVGTLSDVVPITLEYTETSGTEVTGKESDVPVEMFSDTLHEQQRKENELEDFEDETTVDAPQKSFGSRRHLRMIMDLDDDDDE